MSSLSSVGGGMSGIVSGASPYAAPTDKMSNLFAQIDTNGTGSITQDQFNQAFATMNPPGVFRSAGANAIFSQLDPNGTASVSQPDFVNTMTGLMKSLRSDPRSGTSPAGTLASSLQSLNQLGGSSDPLSSDGLGSVVNVLG